MDEVAGISLCRDYGLPARRTAVECESSTGPPQSSAGGGKRWEKTFSLLGSNLQPPGPKADTLTIRPQYIYNVHVTVDAYLM